MYAFHARELAAPEYVPTEHGLPGSAVNPSLDAYDAAAACRAIEAFVDDLSNWYVRRNRLRFWKGELDADKGAAYATLHEVLVTVSGLLAPIVPHLADALWQNLVLSVDEDATDSVHLADFPVAHGRADRAAEQRMTLARRIVGLGRTARAASGLKVRQPLSAVRIKLPARASATLGEDDRLIEEILDELNAKRLDLISDESGMVERTLYPLLPVIGPRHGRSVAAVMAGARSGAWRLLDDGRAEVGGVTLEVDEFDLTSRARPGHEVATDGDLLVALDTELDEELLAEGIAREVAHRLQALRKAAGYRISDRIAASVDGDAQLVARLEPHRAWLAEEILATELVLGGRVDDADRSEEAQLDGASLRLAVRVVR